MKTMKKNSNTNDVRDKAEASFDAMKEEFGYKNKLQAPKIVKVIISSTTGSIKDPKKKTLVGERLTRITGQKVSEKAAKKSIATFKVREGDAVGYQVTLRGARMYDFLNKLIHIVFPRTRDFRGLDTKSIDAMGNFTFGLKEHTVFPETSDEELKDVFGLAVTIVTTSKTKDETERFLRNIGFLFKKQ
jgi:large subunit ribosomal protein L5